MHKNNQLHSKRDPLIMLCYVKFMHVTNFDLRLAIPRPAGGRMEFIQLLSHPFSLSVDVVGNCVYTHRTWQ